MGAKLLTLAVLEIIIFHTYGQVLVPPYTNLALGRKVEASSTCGEVNGQPVKEMYCSIAGSNQYTPLNQYSYSMADEATIFAELKMEKQSFVQGGQNCDFCQANTSSAHPAENMVDGRATWWQSPPLSRGMQYNQVNITIDLEQEFHVAYVWVQMANSPRPGSWILERSVDGGKTYQPWQYFAETPAECDRLFGRATLQPILDDDSVICTHEYSGIHPMENAEIMINLLENRPGKLNFSHSPVLQNFSRATNVRLRLLRTKTLHGHLMDVNRRNDPTVTRRYFYSIKEIFMGGRCVCNGHADTCDILDMRRPRTLLCRCEHNTCGDQCERCCSGYEQKKWQRAKDGEIFICEPCNCNGHSDECVYDEELDKNRLSLDIHGKFEGGGRCLNCRDNTEGINCNKCSFGYYRPIGRHWNETDVCRPCQCDPLKHTGACEEETARCECQPRFMGENCDQCSPGYYSPPECKQCDCSANGTLNAACLPDDGQCPCKYNFAGIFCEKCAAGFTNITRGCEECLCDETGSLHSNCSITTGQCACKPNFAGAACDVCANGYFSHPNCEYCGCDPSGTEAEVCDKKSGKCICKPGFSGERCDQCDLRFHGYPNCKPCVCSEIGSLSPDCDPKTGECPCDKNFTGRMCDRCAAGYYDYPSCKPCSCVQPGSKGMTCDNLGQCYCKPNFDGQTCEKCRPNFYNYPVCEECNCNPNGVVASFGGCDKVAPGELCTCRKHVTGRICDQCKPTYWDLQYHHEDGCISCGCHLPGVISSLGICDMHSGQCICKRHVGGRRCEKCADGFYNLQSHSQIGCQSCKCDIGGALGIGCDIHTGQCRCRPRIAGRKCDTPIENHYFPTLWHNRYEAEDGRVPGRKPVRFAIDSSLFPEFSSRGFAVFSPTQDQILVDVHITKASLYRLLFHLNNPTSVNIDVEISMTPTYTHTQDVEQSVKAVIPPTEHPATITVNSKQPFVLNPGRWRATIKTKQRLFLDYIVFLPSEYFEGTVLKERFTKPCMANEAKNGSCLDLLFPPLPVASRFDFNEDAKVLRVWKNGTKQPLEKVPIEILPAIIGPAAFVRADDEECNVHLQVEVPETGRYYCLLEYHNLEEKMETVKVEISQNNFTKLNGDATIVHCPYATFCRELVHFDGQPAGVYLDSGTADFMLVIEPQHEFGLASVNLIKEDDWSTDYLKQVEVCIRRNGECVDQLYPPAANAVVTEAESGDNVNRTISAEKLPFIISNAKDIDVIALDDTQATLDIAGVVPTRGHYVFIVHYYNPDNTPLTLDVLLQNEQIFHTTLPLSYCPSVFGCRAVIHDKERPEVIQFWVEDKYVASIYFNTSQKGPIYIDSVTTVPYQSYSESLMSPQPIDLSVEFLKECSKDSFKNDPKDVDPQCRKMVFSLTTEFNMAALSCDCNSQGSTSFCCEQYGGQCPCRPNVIGRRCERCAPGFYNFPDCIRCRCSMNQLCDEMTGQCSCPQHVEGTHCERCVPYAFGYDPLIGCQLCNCNPRGSEGGQLHCDPNNGQCLCKRNVGGRNCEECLPGFYGFPHCYECACETKGTTGKICDPTTATCSCKKNVIGPSCDQCRPGTFDIRADNPDGCSECFCFGATDRCRSSFLPITFTNFDEESWRTTDQSGEVTKDHSRIVYRSNDTSLSKNVYFLAPVDVGADHTNSYGLKLSFEVSSQPSNESSTMSTAADVQLVGSNMTLEFWSSEQPSDPKIPFRVEVSFLPEKFFLPTGEQATRPQLMLVLFALQEIRIKASYYERCSGATLNQVELEAASDDQNLVETPVTASSVEICQCPPPYTGPSCQYCAPGYHRVSSGLYLSACVPCDCNGHSGSCDPNTGICSNCQHDTTGDHCEFCREGYYGNATTGSPYSCLPCACPHPSTTNNFAISCDVSETGLLHKCNCKPGYASDRCDRCDTGYFGEPTRLGSECKPCYCSENNDLSAEGSCHPVTGDCAMCLNNTDGRQCEMCRQWYYGDAVTAKNCTECSCNQCGSQQCDNTSGVCLCHPLVEGDTCDRCMANAWGFNRCIGCTMCDCAAASSGSQCHSETGQCPCMPGAAGLHCEKCEDGFWNYGPQGCAKCDCESDLSMGTVCDVGTGQCHCQEGATGPRCDQCLPHYLRIPTLGCRHCDECVHSLNRDLDVQQDLIKSLSGSIGNISTTALMGARLKRIGTQLAEQKLKVDAIVGADLTAKIQNMSSDAASRKSSALDTVIRANRTLDLFDMERKKLNLLSDRTDEIARDAFDRAEVASWVVDSLKDLVSALGTDSNKIDRKEWTDKAREYLDQIRNESESLATLDQVKQAYDEAHALLKRMRERANNRSASILSKLEAFNNKSEELIQTALNYALHLEDVHVTLMEVRQRLANSSIFEATSAINGITNDLRKAQDDIESIKMISNETNQLTESNGNMKSAISSLNKDVEKIVGKLHASCQLSRFKRSLRNQKYKENSEHLENEAKKLSDIFGTTKHEAQGAVDAATIYKNLTENIQRSESLAENASVDSTDAKELSDGQANATREAKEASAKILRLVGEVKQELLNEIGGKRLSLEKKTVSIKSMIKQLNSRADFIRMNMKDDDVETKTDNATRISEKIDQKLKVLREDMEKHEPEWNLLVAKASGFVEKATSSIQESISAKNQLKELNNMVGPAIDELKSLQVKAKNTSDSIMFCREKLNALKEQVALARDMVNRIKLGAHFEKDSSLELPLPPEVTRSAAYTKVELYFRTTSRDGLIMFFGNEIGVAGTRAVPTDDYLSIGVENGKVRVVFDLGAEPLVIMSDKEVADGLWRKIAVERIGRTVTLRVSKPNSDQIEEERVASMDGLKSVLNLHQKRSRLFVGGIPSDVTVSPDVHKVEFVGDIEDLRIHGETVGLWNAKYGGSHNVQGAEKRPLMAEEPGSDSGVSLNGDGYVVHSIDAWNPRKQTIFSLSFLTYSPDGLLLFVGKDRDFLSLEIQDGSVKLSFDFGSGVEKIQTQGRSYNDGSWHLVYVHRVGRHAKLRVDDEESYEGDSPGTMFELSVTDVFYLGGVPSDVSTRTAVVPLRGCIRHVKLESDYINLSKTKAAKGVQRGCPDTSVRVVSFASERSTAVFPKIPVQGDIELTFRFKTDRPDSLLTSVQSDEQENVLQIRLENGFIVVECGAEMKEIIRLEFRSANDLQWHFITVSRKWPTVQLGVDDLYSSSAEFPDVEEEAVGSYFAIQFGRSSSSENFFVGCIGDVTFAGKLLDFSKSMWKEIELTGCPTSDITASTSLPIVEDLTSKKPESLLANELVESSSPSEENASNGDEQEQHAFTTATTSATTVKPPPRVKGPNECTLSKRSLGEREDSTGIRFGLSPSSRLHFDKPPESFDKNSIFSVQLRATASNGIIMFVTNDKHSDHLAVYLSGGHVHFAYNSGSGQVILKSNRSVLDDEWHSIRAEREGIAGSLFIDDILEANGQSPAGTDAIDTEPPIYIGGVAPDIVPFVTRILVGAKPVFGGCLRDFKLNDKKFEAPSMDVGTVPCSTFTESGMFFGERGGYVLLSKDLKVGSSFNIELEIRPRVKTAVLLSVGKVEFLTLQLLNGSIKFSVDNGAGVESLLHRSPAENTLCDGHWHHVKLYKTKNLMTLTVDGKSNLHIMKKGKKTDTNTKDPLYLGGAPKSARNRGLDTFDGYAGCVRVLNMGRKPRRRKNIDLSRVIVFGDVRRNTCPVN